MSARVRLLFVTDTLANGGAERQLALTVAHMAKTHDVRCFSVGDGPFAESLRERGIRVDVVERRWPRDPFPFMRLWWIVATWRPRLVHSWGYMTTLAGFPVFRLFGIPFVDSTIRTGNVDLSGTLRRRAGIERAARVIANSRAGLESARVGPERGRVVHNGFDPSRIPAAVPQRTDGRFTVVMAARMTPSKDYATVLRAVRILLETLDPSALRVLLLGQGVDRESLELRNRDLVEAGVVEFCHAPDVVPRLLTADCGVLMTTPGRDVEGCPNAAIEYMACGLPALCSRGGGTDELIDDGETGLLVAPGDANELAERLAWVCGHRDAACEMGRRGAETIRRDYSLEGMVRATEAVYAEALRG